MSKVSTWTMIVVGVLAGCLIGIPIGYIVPQVYEKNYVHTPTITPTPSTIFVPVDITIEELRAKDIVTVHDIASVFLAGDREDIINVRQAIIDKTLQSFNASIVTISTDKDACVIAVSVNDYPGGSAVAPVSSDWCVSLGINSQVVISGTIARLDYRSKMFVVNLENVSMSVR